MSRRTIIYLKLHCPSQNACVLTKNYMIYKEGKKKSQEVKWSNMTQVFGLSYDLKLKL